MNMEREGGTEPAFESGASVFRFLRRLGFFETRKSEESFETLLKTMTYDQFKEHLVRINGMLRKTPIQERAMDGTNVNISFGISGDQISYLPPRAEVKDGLMEDTFNGLKDIQDDNDRALLLYYAIQAIHPFSDGNGRTGRLLHELLSVHGADLTQEEVSHLVDHNVEGSAGTGKGRQEFAQRVLEPEKAYGLVNREVAKKEFGEDFLAEYGKIYYSGMLGSAWLPDIEGVSPEEKALAIRIISEGEPAAFTSRDITILKLLNETGKLEKCRIDMRGKVRSNEGLREDTGKSVLGIDNEVFEQILTADDIHRLIEIHNEVKMHFVQTMIDIFVHPDTHTLKVRDGQIVPVKEAFRAVPAKG